ncbi:hypothetical protein [Bosea sp. 117]|nr:hypothetical protein [Bosea sp. 117]
MWFLATELWPYLVGALAIGLATGWLCGCKPAVSRRTGGAGDETEVRP